MSNRTNTPAIIAVVATVALAFVTIFNFATFAKLNKAVGLGTDITRNQSNLSYTDGSDLYQNIQAIAERMGSSTAQTILQADASGYMQAVAPSALAGSFSFAGDTRAASFVQTGSIATFTVTSTATAANVCNNPLWAVTPVTTTPTLTLPATSTLYADCLTTNGDFVDFAIKSINTSTILALGTGGNADVNSTSTDMTITPNKSFGLRLFRDSDTTYLLQVDNYNN